MRVRVCVRVCVRVRVRVGGGNWSAFWLQVVDKFNDGSFTRDISHQNDLGSLSLALLCFTLPSSSSLRCDQIRRNFAIWATFY